MAKVKHVKTYPTELHLRLFAPGMSVLHRAGLGGLACTLDKMEDDYHSGRLADEQLPAPFIDGQPPWTITQDSITLRFGQPEAAGPYLKRLFEYGLSIREGLIFLPGQFFQEPPLPVRADLQAGLLLTFLQHGRTRLLDKNELKTHYDPEHEGVPGVAVTYKRCTSFKHQTLYEEIIDKQGRLKSDPIDIDGPISPGTVVRHQAFSADTKAAEPPERLVPLIFAMVGTLALPVNRGVGVLIVPDVTDLEEFVFARRAMTPTTAKDCQIASGADGALRALLRIRDSPVLAAQLRLSVGRQLEGAGMAGCYVMTFRPTPWASQQKSRVSTLYIRADDQRALSRFEVALQMLPPRIVAPTKGRAEDASDTGTKKRARAKKTDDAPQEEYRVDSIIRPWIAENLARGKPWYAGFVDLMTKTNPATKKPYRNQISFERKGLHDMIAKLEMWDGEGEKLVVQAVHEAIRQSLGRIKDETDGPTGPPSQATKNRWERFREKLRLDLAGSKTEAHVRFALMDLFSRGGNNAVLRQHWQAVLPVIRKDWQLARDLGLLALASYAGRGIDEAESDNSLPNSPSEFEQV